MFRQSQEAREIEKQQQKERERMERDRQEREKMEREREREKQEREREQQERERQEKQKALQSVNKHFEESLRRAHQKVNEIACLIINPSICRLRQKL